MTESGSGCQERDGATASRPQVVTLTGALDVRDLAGLSATMSSLDPSDNVVLDVSMVPFADTTILSALLHRLRTQRDSGGSLVLAGPSPAVLRLLELTELASLIPTTSTVDEAFGLMAGHRRERQAPDATL